MSAEFERVQAFFHSLPLFFSLSLSLSHPPSAFLSAFVGNKWIKAKWKWFFQKLLDVSPDLLTLLCRLLCATQKSDGQSGACMYYYALFQKTNKNKQDSKTYIAIENIIIASKISIPTFN